MDAQARIAAGTSIAEFMAISLVGARAAGLVCLARPPWKNAGERLAVECGREPRHLENRSCFLAPTSIPRELSCA
jgi:hypothetical protein